MCFCEKIYVNRRLKSTPLQMLAILRGAPALLVICITYMLFCAVESVHNDQEKKENGKENGDDGKYSHKGYPSFQAQINK